MSPLPIFWHRNHSPAEKVIQNEENCVTVYVWEPWYRKRMFGHAALRTAGENGLYISWCPTWADSGVIQTSAFEKRTLEMDIDYEDRQPTYIIKFYSLNIRKIHEAYEKIQNEGARYHGFGRSSLFLLSSKVSFHNCTSLVAYLLQEGEGVCNNFYSRCVSDSVLRLGSITPQGLALAAQEYEKKERTAYLRA